MRPLNIAEVSTGGAGRAHVRQFEKNQKARLRALFDAKEEKFVDLESYEAHGAYFTADFRRTPNNVRS